MLSILEWRWPRRRVNVCGLNLKAVLCPFQSTLPRAAQSQRRCVSISSLKPRTRELPLGGPALELHRQWGPGLTRLGFPSCHCEWPISQICLQCQKAHRSTDSGDPREASGAARQRVQSRAVLAHSTVSERTLESGCGNTVQQGSSKKEM